MFTDRLETMAKLARQALAKDDPWRGLHGYLTAVCELQAADRGFNEVAARGMPPSPAARRFQEEGQAAITQLLDRAKRAGALRDDLALTDLAFVIWGISRTVEMTAGFTPPVAQASRPATRRLPVQKTWPGPKPPFPSKRPHQRRGGRIDGPARHNGVVGTVPAARHLLRAKDLVDARYYERLSVADLAAVAGLSAAHFSRRFKATFGESPHQYLLTRRLERAAALLRTTDWTVAAICFAVGSQSVGSFTTSFRRMFAGAAGLRNNSHRPSGTCGYPAVLPSPTGAQNTARFEKTTRPISLSLTSTNSQGDR